MRFLVSINFPYSLLRLSLFLPCSVSRYSRLCELCQTQTIRLWSTCQRFASRWRQWTSEMSYRRGRTWEKKWFKSTSTACMLLQVVCWVFQTFTCHAGHFVVLCTAYDSRFLLTALNVIDRVKLTSFLPQFELQANNMQFCSTKIIPLETALLIISSNIVFVCKEILELELKLLGREQHLRRSLFFNRLTMRCLDFVEKVHRNDDMDIGLSNNVNHWKQSKSW